MIKEGFVNAFSDMSVLLTKIFKGAWEKVTGPFSASPIDSPNGAGGKLGSGIVGGILKSVKKNFPGISKIFSKGWDTLKKGASILTGSPMKILQLMQKLPDAMVRLVRLFSQFAKSIWNVATALSKVPESVLSTVTYQMRSVLLASTKITPAKAQAAISVIKEAANYQKEVAANQGQGNTDALAALRGSATGGGGGGDGEMVINIDIAGTPLKRYIRDTVSGQFREASVLGG